MFEYLAQVQSAVRRINYRIETLAKHFGENSSFVNDIKAELEVKLPDNMRYKKGVPQLHTPSGIYKDEDLNTMVEDIDKKMKSWGEYKKEYERQYERYEEEQTFFKEKPISMEKFITTMSKLSGALIEYASEQLPAAALDILRIKGRRKSYAELSKVTDILGAKGYV